MASQPKRLVVDNSQGADAGFALHLASALRFAGFNVDVRAPAPGAIFDTMVHVATLGVAVRAMEDLDPQTLNQVARVVSEAARRQPPRRQSRAIPIYRGEAGRALRWVDVFDAQ